MSPREQVEEIERIVREVFSPVLIEDMKDKAIDAALAATRKLIIDGDTVSSMIHYMIESELEQIIKDRIEVRFVDLSSEMAP